MAPFLSLAMPSVRIRAPTLGPIVWRKERLIFLRAAERVGGAFQSVSVPHSVSVLWHQIRAGHMRTQVSVGGYMGKMTMARQGSGRAIPGTGRTKTKQPEKNKSGTDRSKPRRS
ncbi:hypothetical protein BO71DRAFT_40033 [Aspergillus ellipticus CBS 707.79]|uniref:Uncharacterized protein n=1 Tax=Aspergillus ellipticus CBS 707.79 TaxID=1448320 RepID=A0A319E480_9EURO|nr:hypothetical protein BO71DRAFT_40033 [Aspergillus ellipticus CBS 707.79]